jgi:hypothetical protein
MLALLTRLLTRRPARPAVGPTYPPLIAWDDWSTPPPPAGSNRPYDPRPAPPGSAGREPILLAG